MYYMLQFESQMSPINLFGAPIPIFGEAVEPSCSMCISGLVMKEQTACFMEVRACGGAVPTTAKQEAESEALAACSSILPYHRQTPQKP